VHDDQLVAGGSFGVAGGQSAGRIARWEGTSWSALGGGIQGTVHALSTFQGDLVVRGSFTQAGGQPAQSIARWTGPA